MKKFFLLLPVLLVVTALTTFARSTTNNDPRAEQTFKRLFDGATNVKWSKEEGGYLSVSFNWADRRTIAYFNSDGQLEGCIRGLYFSQLPLTVMRSFDGQFKNSIILEIREISNDEGVNYSILLEQKDKKYKIRLNSAGDLLEKERIKQ
jgi:hypothetical protein